MALTRTSHPKVQFELILDPSKSLEDDQRNMKNYDEQFKDF